jgi:hypothetical protein
LVGVGERRVVEAATAAERARRAAASENEQV